MGQNRAKVNVCNTTLVGLRGLEITELEVLRNHDLTSMDIRYFFGQVKKTSLPPLFDKFVRQINVVTITKKIRNSFYFPGWSPLYTKFMEMPSSFCKIPVNFMIRKVFS